MKRVQLVRTSSLYITRRIYSHARSGRIFNTKMRMNSERDLFLLNYEINITSDEAHAITLSLFCIRNMTIGGRQR